MGRPRSRWWVGLVLSAATTLGLAVSGAPASAEPAHPCRLPGYSAVRFFAVSTAGASAQAQLSARDAKVFCGGPDDGHWYPIGPAHAVRLAPAADLTITLFTRRSSGSFASRALS